MSQTALNFYRLDEEGRSYIPLGSARECKQTLEPMGTAEVFRTLEGKLVSFGLYDKYKSIIECTDTYPIALEGLWPGTTLKVECMASLITGRMEKGGAVRLKRTPVKGSLLLHTLQGECYPLQDPLEEGLVQFEPHQGPGYVSYRPCLIMILKKFFTKNNEWERTVGWQMELEEV